MELMPNNTPNFPEIVDKGVPMAVLKKEIGHRELIEILSLMISKFTANFNVSRNMTADQITDYAMYLIDNDTSGSWENPSYKLEDYAVFFEKAKTGIYGKIYERIDSTIIEEMLDEYHKERSEKYYEHLTKYQHNPKDKTEPHPQANKELLASLLEHAKSIFANKTPTETSLIEQEIITLEIVENKKKMFYGDDKYKELFEQNPNEVMLRIQKLKEELKKIK